MSALLRRLPVSELGLERVPILKRPREANVLMAGNKILNYIT